MDSRPLSLNGSGPPFIRWFVILFKVFCLGNVDISHLSYAILSLIPKVKGAESISQFQPIALINNFAKFPPKGLATRLLPVAHRIINPSQSAFIKGRFILDSVVILHETMHYIHKKKKSRFLRKSLR